MKDGGSVDAVVVGSGPNGLAAAIELGRAGLEVLVLEAEPTVGGGCRTAELTLPGFRHDVCSAIHALALASPFMRSLRLEDRGVEWIHPDAPLAHPQEDGTAAVLERDVAGTAEGLGEDGPAYERLMGPLVRDGLAVVDEFLAPAHIPRHPFAMARFGLLALRSAAGLAADRFRGVPARALFTGLAAHSMQPLDRPPTAAFGLMLGLVAHLVGWPMAAGGSQAVADAMASELEGLGGRIETDRRVASLDDLPAARATILDVTPRQLVAIAGDRLPSGYRRAMERFRYGPGVFKLDWALDGPIPWKAEACGRAATVHLGGTMREMVASESRVANGEHPSRPYVLLVQQTLFDPSRAPAGKHTAWAYCHVPNGSTVDMTSRIEDQVERFAPGFRDLILARSVMGPEAMETHDANYVGGDINGGVQDLRQLYTRPVLRLSPYTTPVKGLFICSSSTPPGGGVHGMSGYFAARAALRTNL